MRTVSLCLFLLAALVGSPGCDVATGSITGDVETAEFDFERTSGRPCGLLQNDRPLYPGEFVYSCNGAYVLVMQGDGNLVVYGPSGALWSTLTGPLGWEPGPRWFPAPGIRYGVLGYMFVMQSDGNAVLYNSPVPHPNNAVFCTRTDLNFGSFMIMQDDGNLVVYRADGWPLWSRWSGRLY